MVQTFGRHQVAAAESVVLRDDLPPFTKNAVNVSEGILSVPQLASKAPTGDALATDFQELVVSEGVSVDQIQQKLLGLETTAENEEDADREQSQGKIPVVLPEFFQLCKRGSEEALNSYLTDHDSDDLNALDPIYNRSGLQHAILGKNAPVVALLLGRKVKVTVKELLAMAKNKQPEILRLFMTMVDPTTTDIDLTDHDETYKNALHWTCMPPIRKETEEVVAWMLKFKNAVPDLAAHRPKEPDTPATLHGSRADGAINGRDLEGCTPLLYIIRATKFPVAAAATVQHMIVNGADVNIPDKYHRSALHFCAKFRVSPRVFNTILSSPSVNVNAVDDDRNTPLMASAERGHHALLEVLLQRRDIHKYQKNSIGQNAVHLASLWSRSECLRTLLRSGFGDKLDHNRDHNGHTPLHYVALANSTTSEFLQEALLCVMMLLSAGCSPHAAAHDHMTPLSLAEWHHNYATAEVMVSYRP